MLLNSFQMQSVSRSDHKNAFKLKNHKHFLIGKISKLATHYSCARFRNSLSLSLWLFQNHFTLICDMRFANHLEQSPKSTWISFSFLSFCIQLLLHNFVCSVIFFFSTFSRHYLCISIYWIKILRLNLVFVYIFIQISNLKLVILLNWWRFLHCSDNVWLFDNDKYAIVVSAIAAAAAAVVAAPVCHMSLFGCVPVCSIALTNADAMYTRGSGFVCVFVWISAICRVCALHPNTIQFSCFFFCPVSRYPTDFPTFVCHKWTWMHTHTCIYIVLWSRFSHMNGLMLFVDSVFVLYRLLSSCR